MAPLQKERNGTHEAGKREQASDEWLCCNVVVRCAVLRGGKEVWVAASYLPQSRSDGSWVTSKEVPRLLPTTAAHTSERGPSKPPPRKRRAKSREETLLSQLPPATAGHPAASSFVELHADGLLQQLEATSTEEVLRMLESEEGHGEFGLGDESR